jgi:hypothetical protein
VFCEARGDLGAGEVVFATSVEMRLFWSGLALGVGRAILFDEEGGAFAFDEYLRLLSSSRSLLEPSPVSELKERHPPVVTSAEKANVLQLRFPASRPGDDVINL